MSRKKILTAIFAAFVAAMPIFAEDSIEIDSAIKNAAESIKSEIPAGSIIAVARFSSDATDLSQYIQTNMETLLKRQGFLIVEKNDKNLKMLNAELDYQYSGNVNDDYLAEIGNQLGAQYLVYGYFEQLGSYMSLYVRASNISTMESPVIENYSIRKNSKLNELLGEAKNMEAATDFLEAIARCKTKILSIQREKDKETERSSASIRAKYQVQINAVNKWTQDPWESDDEFAARKSSEIASIGKKRDTEIKGEKDRITIQYNNMTRSVEISEREIKSKLEQTKFVLKGESQVNVFVGNFQKNAKPKHWPIEVKSLDSLVPYKISAKHEINDADLRTEYTAFEEVKASGIIEGEITYSVLPNCAGSFDVIVQGYKVLNTETGAVYLNVTVNANVNKVSAATNITKSSSKASKKSSKQSKKKIDESVSSANFSTEAEPEYEEEETEDLAQENTKSKSRVCDVFGAKYLFLSDWIDYTMHGVSLNALSSNFGHFFVNWINADLAFGSSAMFLAASVDAGAWIRLGRFFPYAKIGIGGFHISYELDGDSSYEEYKMNDYSYDVSDSGFLLKFGLGTDFKLSDNWKIVAGYDLRVLSGGYNVADSFNLGICYGKPRK